MFIENCVSVKNGAKKEKLRMKRILICLALVLVLAAVANAQIKSMTGTVVSVERGMYKWVTIVVRVGNKDYFVYTESGNHPTPKIVGKVEEVGRTVQFFYTKIETGNEVFATKIVEVKKSNTPAKETSSDTCRFCGIWEYYDRSEQSTYYLNISRARVGRFRFIPGYVGVGGQIAWLENLMIRNADGIYLKTVNRNLLGSFVSMNFRATGGDERNYRITCELKSNGKMVYTVASSGFVERHMATKKN